MTYGKLRELIVKHNIPYSVKLMSDSGCEYDTTEINGVYYNRKENIIVFAQDAYPPNTDYDELPDWELLYGEYPEWCKEE